VPPVSGDELDTVVPAEINPWVYRLSLGENTDEQCSNGQQRRFYGHDLSHHPTSREPQPGPLKNGRRALIFSPDRIE